MTRYQMLYKVVACGIIALFYMGYPQTGYAQEVDSIARYTNDAASQSRVPAQKFGPLQPEHELRSRRTSQSKHYLNPDGSLTAVVSSGYMHYADSSGFYHEIDRNFRQQGDEYTVTRGLFHASLPVANALHKPAVFETKAGSQFRSQLISVGYYHPETQEYIPLHRFTPDSVRVIGNTLTYVNAFPGMDVEYTYLDTRLKEELIIYPEARKQLPHPGTNGLSNGNILLVMKNTIGTSSDVMPYAHGRQIAEIRQSPTAGQVLSFQTPFAGTDRIEFRNIAHGKSVFQLPVDKAYLQSSGDSSAVAAMTTVQNMQRYISTKHDETTLFTGVPWSWMDSLPAGTIILDPTVELQPAPHDVWIEYPDDYNFNSYDHLRVGRQRTGYGWKRSLVQFDLNGIPAEAFVTSAEMRLYYKGQSVGVHVTRTIQGHQMLKDWDESQATWYRGLTGLTWTTAGVGLDDVDAKSSYEDSFTAGPDDHHTWKILDITNLTQRWVDGTDPNYGVLIWATDETAYTDADEKYFWSSEYTGDTSLRPKMIITYSTEEPLAAGEFAYDTQGRLTRQVYLNGMEEKLTYDQHRGWVTSRSVEYNGTELFYWQPNPSHDQYDDVGNLILVNDNHTESYAYEYDNLNQLVEWFPIQGDAPRETYTYDASGNLVNYDGVSYPVNSGNNRLSKSGYAYDANGNMTTHKSKSVTYDWRNMMTGYDGGTNTYEYDAYGERVKKIESGVTRYYVTSGPNIVAEYNSGGTLVMEHLYANGTRYATVIPGSDTYYKAADQIRSSRVLVDANGNVDQQKDYTPYGKGDGGYGALSKYLFSGKEQGAGGLYYFGARYYDPTIGRWLSTDPAGQTFNPYLYTGNNPLRFVDPDGEFFFSAIIPGLGSIIDAALWGAVIGGSVSSATYSVVSGGDFTWSGAWNAFKYGAIGGAASGGVGAGLTSAFGQNLAFNILGQSAGYAANVSASGGSLTWQGMAGAIAGGVVSGHFAGFQGVKGGGWNNLVAEMAHGTVRGAWAGGIGGMASSGLSGQNILTGFFQGAKYGAASGAGQTGLSLAMFGYAVQPDPQKNADAIRGLEMMESEHTLVGRGMGKFRPVYRSGGLMGLITPGIAIGRNLVVPYDKAVGRRGNYTFGHETAHYYQQISQGYSKFLARGAYEQWLMVNNPYTTPGTQEWAAHNLWKSY